MIMKVARSQRRIGVAFGLAAALCYGVGGFMIGRYTRDFGWLVPVVVARGGAMVLLLGLLATPLRGPVGPRRGPGIPWALAAGLADAAGLSFSPAATRSASLRSPRPSRLESRDQSITVCYARPRLCRPGVRLPLPAATRLFSLHRVPSALLCRLDPAESSNSFTPLSYSRPAFKPAAS